MAFMNDRPYVLLSCAMSVDGHIDDTSDQRLMLSNAEDVDRVDAVRADCDAILVGAATVRRDNPRLLIRSAERRAARVARGLPEHPTKVTVTNSGFDPDLAFFTTDGEKLVYCPTPAVEKVREDVGDRAAVVGAGALLDDAGLSLGTVLDDLGRRGVRRLLVEGGSTIHTGFLTRGLVDEIQLAVAPFFVGQDDAPRFVTAGRFSQDARHRMTLAEVRRIGDMVLMRYLTS
jgi:5-amino-6-(5-phosphoribosylamino)uracil reductase